MATVEKFRSIALSFPEAMEQPHFENTSFRVAKKIFATLNEREKKACVKFNEIDQNVFSAFDTEAIYPVPNKWGKQGWTFIHINKVKLALLVDALTVAYCGVAPRKLSTLVTKE